MTFLIDQGSERVAGLSRQYDFVGGQLLTPLSRYLPWEGTFGIDNGAYSSCDVPRFKAFVDKLRPAKDRCLWLAVPDVVGSARRTLEVFAALNFDFHGWPLALVCQDGQQDHAIPWDHIKGVFIGGSTEWKMSQHAIHILKAAQLLGKHTHVGRVNTPERFAHFNGLGVETCDGSGASRYDWMLDKIADSLKERPLLEERCAIA